MDHAGDDFDDFDQSNAGGGSDEDSDSGGAAAPAAAGGKEPEPPSFSRVDLTLSDKQLRKAFPAFPGV
jgi:hypothetical protein